MRALMRSALIALALGAAAAAQPPSATFDAYVIDVEGGEATLFVAPSGESMLVDAGWPGFDGRDADRIVSVARLAGVQAIDYLVVTHFHTDHMGGAAPLAARLPVRRFVDHGTTVDRNESAQAAFQTYADLRRRATHIEARPGDTIPIAGLNVAVIASGGSVLRRPLEGAGLPNPLCEGFTFHGPEITSRAADPEDSRSVSLFIAYGEFKTIIMGDLTWNREHELMCPSNNLGTVDAYLVSHHGSDTSGSEALVHALRPRVGIMNNGPRKGGAIQTFRILRASPGFEDLWQNHYSLPAGDGHNWPEPFIANLEPSGGAEAAAAAPPVHMGPAHWIRLSAQRDGSFSVTNSRTGQTKRYPARNRQSREVR